MCKICTYSILTLKQKIMEFALMDMNDNPLKLGDTVEILKITNDSGMASQLFDVEPQLDGWVEQVYIEEFRGVITYDTDLMMIRIESKRTGVPLSKTIRFYMFNELFQNVDQESLEEIKKDYEINELTCKSMVDYIVKID